MTFPPRYQRLNGHNVSFGKTKTAGRHSRGNNGILWMVIILVVIIQLFLMISYNNCTEPPRENRGHQLKQSDLSGVRPVSSFWWPTPETSGGFLSAIHNAQHPKDCSAKSTKYFVMRSLQKNDGDNRGLSAWASVTMMLMLQGFSDSDNLEHGGRVLINDEELWPMAKGCKRGPETRECYFLPLSKCKLSDADPIDDPSVVVLAAAKDEYDRSARTVYSSQQKYTRLTNDKISWSNLTGSSNDHSYTTLVAAFLAYNLQPQPWLKKEIDTRLRRSLPANLNPDRTIGVPIRRSDKCFGHTIPGSAGGELDCPPLEEYLDAVKSFLRFDPLISNVIVTSEDSSACSEFLALLKKELPNLSVIMNVGDVQQGTGSASKLEAYKDVVNNADVVASALTSFHMHLRARYFVLTTKSSWTSSIAIFARIYGFASDVYVIDIGRNRNMYADIARRGG